MKPWINGHTARIVTEQVTQQLHAENPELLNLLIGHGVNWRNNGAIFELYFDRENPVAERTFRTWPQRTVEVVVEGIRHQVTLEPLLKRTARL